MRLLDRIIQNLEIEVQLPKIDRLECAFFQFHGDKRIQFTIEEEQINEMLVSCRLDTVLVSDERKIPAKFRNELADVGDNRFLDNACVNILRTSSFYIVKIYEVQQIFVAEHPERLPRKGDVGNSRHKVARHCAAMEEVVALDTFTKLF